MGGLLVSADIAADGKPVVLWLETANGDVWYRPYRLSRYAAGFWSVTETMDYEFGEGADRRYHDQGRVFFTGGEVLIGARDTLTELLHIARPPTPNTLMTPFLTVGALPALYVDQGYAELGFDDKYQLVRDGSGMFHLVVRTSPPSGPDTLAYYTQSGTTDIATGPAPVSDGEAGEGLSLALGPSDTPVISYYASAAGGIRLSVFEGGAWTSRDLDASGIGHRSRVRFDASGKLHIAYEDVATGGVKLFDEVCE
jgi:hypothetical protein